MNKKGFSLLEVFLSLAICAGLLMSIVSVVNFHLKTVADYKQRDGLYNAAGNVFELMKKNRALTQGRLIVPYADYAYQADILASPYQGIDLLTMTITGPREEFMLSEYILSRIRKDQRNDEES